MNDTNNGIHVFYNFLLYHFFALLGCYAAYVGICLSTFRDSLAVLRLRQTTTNLCCVTTQKRQDPSPPQQKPDISHTRVGTLIVATIYLQLIQIRYKIRSFTVLQCSHQHCVQPVASDVEVVGYL